jgi:acetone carboxylase gamma subunit
LTPAPTPRKVDNPVEEIEEEPKKKKYKCECGSVLGQDDKWYIDNHKKEVKHTSNGLKQIIKNSTCR